MNNLFRIAIRLNKLRPLSLLLQSNKSVVSSQTNICRHLARNIWYMSNSRQTCNTQEHSQFCSCGCGSRKNLHSKAEKELVEFLTEEILAERKSQKVKTLTTQLDGFEASLNGAEVTFTKKTENENIKISWNINHTVDTDAEPELQESSDKPEIGELKSKPAFKVDITRSGTTLSVLCSFVSANEQEEGYNDIFGIDELSIYSGDWNENIYSVSGEVLDSYLYDLLLNYLEEKGISNEFVEKLSNYSTAYEHSAYIGLLEGISKFVSGK